MLVKVSDVYNYPCPFCNAPANEFCQTQKGVQLNTPHSARIHLNYRTNLDFSDTEFPAKKQETQEKPKSSYDFNDQPLIQPFDFGVIEKGTHKFPIKVAYYKYEFLVFQTEYAMLFSNLDEKFWVPKSCILSVDSDQKLIGIYNSINITVAQDKGVPRGT